MLKDPVCGKRINRGKAHVIIEHQGVDYLLCCPMCQAEFERAPATYANPKVGEKVKQKKRSRKIQQRQRH
jgi:YHS domain-containing protein